MKNFSYILSIIFLFMLTFSLFVAPVHAINTSSNISDAIKDTVSSIENLDSPNGVVDDIVDGVKDKVSSKVDEVLDEAANKITDGVTDKISSGVDEVFSAMQDAQEIGESPKDTSSPLWSIDEELLEEQENIKNGSKDEEPFLVHFLKNNSLFLILLIGSTIAYIIVKNKKTN